VARAVITRRDPEEILRKVQAEERRQQRGRLKVFLGYASGVGKSCRMIDEGRRRRERNGEDVVIGATQLRVTPEVEELLQKMEVIPVRLMDGAPVMDVDRILARRPQVCLVDGLAYDNPPGSRHAHRWQDVEELLEAGISVIASVNLQYIEEQKEQVGRIRGRQVEESVPQAFLNMADEIEVVDAAPESCIAKEGETAEPDLKRRQQELAQLREIALLLAADVVDRQLENYLEQHGIRQIWGAHERFLVWLTPGANAEAVISSGLRNARRFHGELYVAHIAQPDLTADQQAIVERNLSLARATGAQIEALDGEDPVGTVLRFARSRGITQVFVARGTDENWWERLLGGAVDRLIRDADGIDVRVFPS
jgi:two-component system, OmpR family, sensor histidine kinase KdpD